MSDPSTFPFGTPARRVKLLRVNADMLLHLFKNLDGSNRISCAGLPDDSQVIRSWIDKDAVCLLLESDDFEPVELGTVYPEIDPLLTVHASTSWRNKPALF